MEKVLTTLHHDHILFSNVVKDTKIWIPALTYCEDPVRPCKPICKKKAFKIPPFGKKKFSHCHPYSRWPLKCGRHINSSAMSEWGLVAGLHGVEDEAALTLKATQTITYEKENKNTKCATFVDTPTIVGKWQQKKSVQNRQLTYKQRCICMYECDSKQTNWKVGDSEPYNQLHTITSVSSAVWISGESLVDDWYRLAGWLADWLADTKKTHRLGCSSEKTKQKRKTGI